MTFRTTALLDELFARSAVDNPPRVPTPSRHTGISPEMLPMNWRIEWEERAAIMEYDSGLSRGRAEAEALADILGQMRLAGESIPREVA